MWVAKYNEPGCRLVCTLRTLGEPSWCLSIKRHSQPVRWLHAHLPLEMQRVCVLEEGKTQWLFFAEVSILVQKTPNEIISANEYISDGN